MTDRTFNLQVPKHPQLRTPISDVGLESKERGTFQSSLSTISELVDHQHPLLVTDDATKMKRDEREFHVELKARLKKGVRPTQAMLDEAIRLRSMRSVQNLLQRGVRIDRPVDWRGNTRLHLACRNGEADQVNFLIGCGANPIAENRLGETPIWLVLMDAEIQESPERQYALLREFARVDKRVDVVLDFAMESDRSDIFALMIAEGFVEAHKVFWQASMKVDEELLLNLDAVFKIVHRSNNKEIVANCVDALCHIIRLAGTNELARHARQVLRDWSNASDLVRPAYDGCLLRREYLCQRLKAFEEETKL
jgi:hypothetical protein